MSVRAPSRWLLLSGLLAASAPCVADTERDLVRRGNEHFAAGRFAEAQEAYRAALDRAATDDAEVLHDLAAAQFKLGDVAGARETWTRAATLKGPAFEGLVRYNLGNCDYADALAAQAGGDVKAATGLLQRASEKYLEAVRLDPALLNARANLELAQRLIRELEQRPTSQDSQPDSQPSSQSGSQPSSQQQPGSQPSSGPGEPQSQPAGQTRPQSEPTAQSQPEPQSQPPPESSPSAESNASADSRPAAESEPSHEPQEPLEARLSREQAERLLEKVREAERRRRQVLMEREAARYKKVDRDW